MPTYEFRCPKGHEFTRFYKTMSSAAMQLPCPECSAVADRQLSAGGGLLFKGSGFYLTDYGKNAHRKPEGGRGKEEGAALAKAEAKPDSKSEAGPKPDAKPAAKSEAPKGEGKKAQSSKPKAQSKSE